MSNDDNPLAQIADSILEHADAIARLDGDMPAAAFHAAYSSHVRAMRVLAVPHMDPQPDRELVRSLKNPSSHVAGVHIRMPQGGIQLIIDSANRQYKVSLWNRRQLLANEEDDARESR